MKEFKLIGGTISLLLESIIIVISVIEISRSYNMLFHDPTYTLIALLFVYLLMYHSRKGYLDK